MNALQNIKRSWFTIASLVSKDFKLKYRRSILGVAWSVLNPLLMMLVLTAVFSTFFRFSIEDYPVYLILGNTLFALVMNAAGSAMTSIIDSATLINKIKINKIIFPIEKVLFELVNFAISLIAVVLVIVFLQVDLTWNLIFLPFLLVYCAVFALGLGLLLAALAVFFRDVVHIWSVIVTAWTYATPLFYPIEILPDWMIVFEQFNPMYLYVTYFRDIVLWGVAPSFSMNLMCLGIAMVMLIIGLIVFRKFQNKFIFYI